MKKIVALVLCLALALSLCTVAFADTKMTTIAKKGYEVAEKLAGEGTKVADDFTKTVTDKKVVTEGDETTTTYYADKYVIDGTTYYACDASIASKKLIKDGKVVAFLTTDDLSLGAKVVATKKIEAKDAEDQSCGDLVDDAFVIDGKNYVVGGTELAMYNGLMVKYTETKVATVPHFTGKVTKTTNTKAEIVSVTCEECDKTFKVVENDDSVLNTYVGEVNTVLLAEDGLVVLMGAAATTTAGSTTVESAKTFDAGIALYAGMALASVAGSAVVIGKKKEF